MGEPYENQLIGAFIYAAGYKAATIAARTPPGQAAPAPVPVNLFQQTPLDRAFNDLVIGAERCLVIEFKRSQAKVLEEGNKRYAGNLKQRLKVAAVRKRSVQGHVVVYGRPTLDSVELRVCSYLAALGIEPAEKLDRGSALALLDILFSDQQADEPGLGISGVELFQYLHMLADVRGGSADGSRSNAWIGVSWCGGQPVFHVAASLGQLLSIAPAKPEHDPPAPQPVKHRRPPAAR